MASDKIVALYGGRPAFDNRLNHTDDLTLVHVVLCLAFGILGSALESNALLQMASPQLWHQLCFHSCLAQGYRIEMGANFITHKMIME